MTDNKADAFAMGLLIVLVVALFWPMIHNNVSVGDYVGHVQLARGMAETGTLESPHFLYQWLIIIAHILIPDVGFFTLGAIVSAVFYLFLSLVLYALIRPALGKSPSYKVSLAGTLTTLSVMLVTPITLFTRADCNLYYGYLYNSNVYHNPTIVLIKPLSLLLFLCATKIYNHQSGYSPKTIVSISTGVLVLLSAMAKPSYIICLLPALALSSIYRKFYKRQPVDWQLLILGIVLPSVVILGWQYYATFTPSAIVSEPSRIIFAPFLVFSFYSSWLFPKFVMSILFPVCVYILYFKKAAQDVHLNLCWLVFLVGAFYTYFLAETGNRVYYGNFGWSGQITSFVLFTISTRFFIQQEAKVIFGNGPRKFSKASVICAIVFGLHLISGRLWYYVNIIGIKPVDWW